MYSWTSDNYYQIPLQDNFTNTLQKWIKMSISHTLTNADYQSF